MMCFKSDNSFKRERMMCFKSDLKYANKQRKSVKDYFPYDLWIPTRQGFNYTWNPYFERIPYFLRRSIRQQLVFFFFFVDSLLTRFSLLFNDIRDGFGFIFSIDNFMLTNINFNSTTGLG